MTETMPQYVFRRGHQCWFQRKVPLDLQPLVGKRTISISLRTKDAAEAGRQARRLAVRLDRQWHALRERSRPRDQWEHYADSLQLAPGPDPDQDDRTEHDFEEAPEPAALLSSLIEPWAVYTSPRPESARSVRLAVKEFGDPPYESITKRALAEQRAEWSARMAPATAQKRLANISLLLAYAVNMGLLESNPASGLGVRGAGHNASKRAPAAPDAIRAAIEATEGGTSTARWIVLLSAFCGLRLGEILSLHKGDVQQIAGAPFIHVHGDGLVHGAVRRVKSRSAVRIVPVPVQARAFVAWAKARPAGELFDQKPNKNGYLGGSEILPAAGVPVQAHSLRHAYADMLRTVDVPHEVQQALLGHSRGGVTGAYGSVLYPTAPLLRAARAISKLA